MRQTKAKQPAPRPSSQTPVADEITNLNLRLAYWTDYPGRPTRKDEEELHWWVESRAKVWFDHKILSWRAFEIRDEEGDQRYQELVSSVGYDPMDAVDQLAYSLDYTTRPNTIPFNSSWSCRSSMETDRARGYGPQFIINPYHYTLEPSYQATVVRAGHGYIAYLEKQDGRVFVGAADNPIHAVAQMQTDMACKDCSQTLSRIPGTDITVPMTVAVDLGIVEDEPPISMYAYGGPSQ